MGYTTTQPFITSPWQLFCLEPHKVLDSSRHSGWKEQGTYKNMKGVVWLKSPKLLLERDQTLRRPFIYRHPSSTLFFVMLLLLDKLLLWRVSAAPGRGLFLFYCHIWRNKNSHGVTGGAVWVRCGEDKACRHDSLAHSYETILSVLWEGKTFLFLLLH